MLTKNYATGPVQLPASYGEFELSGIIFIILSSCIGEVEWKARIYQNQQICTSVLRPLQLSAADLALKTKLSAASLCKGRRQQSSLQLSDPSSGENQGLLYCRVRKVLPVAKNPKTTTPSCLFLGCVPPSNFQHRFNLSGQQSSSRRQNTIPGTLQCCVLWCPMNSGRLFFPSELFLLVVLGEQVIIMKRESDAEMV